MIDAILPRREAASWARAADRTAGPDSPARPGRLPGVASNPTQIALGLDRTRNVLLRLGRPETCAPALHVAGTNGKGSVCAMVPSCARCGPPACAPGSIPRPTFWPSRSAFASTASPSPTRPWPAPSGAVRGTRAWGSSLTYFEFATAMAFLGVSRRLGRRDGPPRPGWEARPRRHQRGRASIAAAITPLGLTAPASSARRWLRLPSRRPESLKPGLTLRRGQSARPEAASVLVARASTVGATLWVEEARLRSGGRPSTAVPP